MIIPTRDHAPVAPGRGCRAPLRPYCIEANSHIAPPKRYLSRYGQLLEHAPYCERDLRGPAGPLPGRGHRRAPTETEVYIKHRGGAGRRVVGRSLLRRSTRSTSSGGTGASTPTSSTSATSSRSPDGSTSRRPVHQVFEGLELRRLQLRAPQGRLPPAVDPGAVLPLQRRQRRDHVLRRRRLRGPRARASAGVDLGPPGRPRARTAAGRDRGVDRRGVLRRAGRHGGHVPAVGSSAGLQRLSPPPPPLSSPSLSPFCHAARGGAPRRLSARDGARGPPPRHQAPETVGSASGSVSRLAAAVTRSSGPRPARSCRSWPTRWEPPPSDGVRG